jgi:L-ascorbate metabolism protein UlaG (beta-lactamase superfamily)
MVDFIHWLGHDSFRLDGPVTIYIDPWKLRPNSPTADLILITHDHYDHFSADDINAIRKKDTEIVAPACVATKLAGKVQTVKPGDRITPRGVLIEVLPAYNVEKRFHPRKAGHVGYVITVNGLRIYHAGDTDAIPEMAGLKPDVALVPVSGTYVMDADEALEAVRLIEPKVAIPMHYGDIVGTTADAERFKLKSAVEVMILSRE